MATTNRYAARIAGMLAGIALLGCAPPADAAPVGAVELGFPVVVDFGGNREARAEAVALQPDGRAVMVGSVDVAQGTAFAITRRLVDGGPDLSFAGTGTVELSLGPGMFALGGWVGVLPDGRIMAVGMVLTGTELNDPGYRLMVLRLLPDGGFDTSFSLDGRLMLGGDEDVLACALPAIRLIGVLPLDAGYSGACGVVMAPDGRVTIAATGIQGALLLQLRPDGSAEPAFGSAGRVNVSAAMTAAGTAFAFATDLVATDDGGFVLAGYTAFLQPDAPSAVTLARVRANGTVDTGFGGNAGALALGDLMSVPHSLQRLPDGRYAIGLWLQSEFGGLYGAARFLANGRPDPSYGTGGVATAIPAIECNGSEACSAHAMHVDHRGRAYVVGTVPQPPVQERADADIAVARFTAQGLPDPSWGPGGARRYGDDLYPFIKEQSAQAVLQDGAGRLVIVGWTDRPPVNQSLESGMELWRIFTDDLFRDSLE